MGGVTFAALMGNGSTSVRGGFFGRCSLLVLVVLTFCGSLFITTTSAVGAVGHEYLSQLTETPLVEPLAAPEAVAIDSSNNVWVDDPGKGVIDEFDSSGAFLRQAAGGHFAAGGSGIYTIAVAPTSRDLYAADSQAGVVDVFGPNGAFKEAWNGLNVPGEHSKTPQGGFQRKPGEGKLGVAIDQSTGEVYVANDDPETAKYKLIDKFNAAGEYQSQMPDPHPETIRMTASGGDLYTLSPGAGGNVVEKFDATGKLLTTLAGGWWLEPTDLGEGDEGISNTIYSGIAVDSTNHLYVVNSRRKVVDEYSASGEYLGQIDGGETPARHLIDPGGVAVNSAEDVYLTDFDPIRSSPGEGTGVVDVFGAEVLQRTLAVSVTGGAGTHLGAGQDSSVLSSPAGIEETWGCKDPLSPLRPPLVAGNCGFHPDPIFGCEWKCLAQFAPGTPVVLTETPATGFKFTKWTGCESEPSNTECAVKLTADTTVEAAFTELQKFPVTVVMSGKGSGSVISEPPGIECPAVCSHEFFESQKVQLTAKAQSGSEIGKWTGCEAEPSKEVCEVVISKATEVKIEFKEIPQRTLTVVETGSGGGTVTSEPPGIKCPEICSHPFNFKEEVILKAEPDKTSRVVKWVGCESEPSKMECKVSLSADISVTAEFEAIAQKTLTVSVAGAGSGVVRSKLPNVGIECGVKCSQAYNEGTIVELVAQRSDATSVFQGWQGGGCSGTGTCAVTLSEDVQVSAVFATVSVPACINERLRGEQSFDAGLPDCRAYELVSPVEKNGNDAVVPAFYGRAAVSGDAVTYESKGSFSGPVGAPFNSQYLSRREVGGWSTRNISPPTTPDVTTPLESQWTGMDFTGDLSKGLLVNGDPPLTADAPAGFESLYVSDIADGSYQFVAETEGVPYQFAEGVVAPGGASADLSHVVFEKKGEVFEWVDGQVSSVSGGPAHVGAGQKSFIFDGEWHAVSVDGSRVFFTRHETGFGNEEGQLFVRKDGSATVQVSVSQRTVADPHGPQPALFWGASADGSEVFFTSTAELTNDANTGPADNAANLYEFNVDSGALSDLTVDHVDVGGAGVEGVVAMSEDGGYVYFVASGVLASGGVAGQSNLYLSHGGVTSFIATLGGGGDGSDWQEGLAKNTAAVTPDGTRLAFQSSSGLTGYDNRDANTGQLDEEVFLYDAVTSTLVCASCNSSGERPIGGSSLYARSNDKNRYRGQGFLYKPRSFSDDGERLFFNSADALVSQDSNGLFDVYEFEGGFVSLVSDGAGSAGSFLQDVSPSGDDVFFATADRLLGQDQDNRVDLYDARVGGGFPVVGPGPAGCGSGESCRPPVSSVPGVFGAPASSTFSGVGNLAPSVGPPPPPRVVVVKRLSGAQKLASALRACRKKSKGKRVACEVKARRQYRAAKKARARRAARP